MPLVDIRLLQALQAMRAAAAAEAVEHSAEAARLLADLEAARETQVPA